MNAGTAAATSASESRNQVSNDPIKCQELAWVCVPLAVETMGHRTTYHILSFWHLD